MRTSIAAMLCTLFVSSACTQPQTPASIPGGATAAQSRPTNLTRPQSLVAALGGRLAVLGSLDGSASYIPGKFTDVSSIAVTVDGRSLLVANGPKDCEARQYQPEIDRVVIETGARDRIVGGAESPAVNEESIVAYGGVCDGLSLGFTDFVTGQNFRSDALDALASGPSLTTESVRPLAWLSDGRTLFYEVLVSGEAHPRYYFGRVWPFVSPNERVVRDVGAALRSTGFDPTAAALVNDKTIAFAQDYSAGSRVREWDVSTENFRADRSFQLPETITALTADPSGTHFLALTRRGVLYRWSIGDTAPTKLADGVSAAAWLL